MQDDTKTLIFGKNGFLGSHLHTQLRSNSDTTFGYRSKNNKLIIERNSRIIRELSWGYHDLIGVIHELQPQVVVNAIALTNVERCESSPNLAWQANSEIPSILAIASNQVGARIIQISTDAVFGQNGSHFRENDEPQPKSIYGKTKLQGEKEVIRHAPKHLIVRTNFYGHHESRPTLFNYFYNNLLSGNSAKGYSNVIFNPVYVKDLVSGIEYFIKNETQGILHFVGDEVLSKYDLGSEILRQIGNPQGLLTSHEIGNEETYSFQKLDLTLSSEIRESLFKCNFDVMSGVRDAIINAKGDENEL